MLSAVRTAVVVTSVLNVSKPLAQLLPLCVITAIRMQQDI
jgi:hypothetical protein